MHLQSSAADMNLQVQQHIAAFTGSLSQYAPSTSITRLAAAAAAAAPAAPFSSQSSTEQPLTPALSQAPTPQRSGLLGISSSSTSSRAAGEPLNALTAALPSSAGFSLVPSMQQQQQHLQQFAQAGMAQLQEVTVTSAALLPVVASMREAAADSQAKLKAVDAFFQQHPQLMDPAALQRVVNDNKQLSDTNRQLTEHNLQLQDEHKQLRNELFGQRQQLNSAVAALREHQRTPADKKTAALQEQVRMLTQQLHARDAALATSEQDNRRLRDELGLPHRSLEECRTGSDLSPCKAEGERYGSSPSQSASPDVSRRLQWGDEDEYVGGEHSSTCSIASGSLSPDVQQRQQQQQQRSTLQREIEGLQGALDAKDVQLQQLQQVVEQLRQEQEANLKRECECCACARMLLLWCVWEPVHINCCEVAHGHARTACKAVK
jgi:hypothetical protein